MIWRADCRHNLVAVGSQLSVLVEDVLPAFVIEDHGTSVRVDCFGKDTQGLSASWAEATAGQGWLSGGPFLTGLNSPRDAPAGAVRDRSFGA